MGFKWLFQFYLHFLLSFHWALRRVFHLLYNIPITTTGICSLTLFPQSIPLPVSPNAGGNGNRLQLSYSESLAFHPFPILPTPTIRNTDGQWQIEQKAALFHCASCWQQLGVWVNEVQPQSITGFSAHSQTTVCAGIDRQSPKLSIIGSLSVIRKANLDQYVQNQLKSACLQYRIGQPLEPALVSSAHHDSP